MPPTPRKLGRVYLLALIAAALIGGSTPSGFNLGDKLFALIGLRPWSGNYIGMHYPGLLTLGLLLIGLIGVKKDLGGWYAVGVILLGPLAFSPLAAFGQVAYYATQSGLGTIGYNSNQSQLQITTDQQRLVLSGHLYLTNYGSRPVRFGVKVLRDQPHAWPLPSEIPLQQAGLSPANTFVLPPGVTAGFSVQAAVYLAKPDGQGSGTLATPDLLLYTPKESRIVGLNR